MTTTRQAQHLNGADRGKHIQFIATHGRYTGPHRIQGELIAIRHLGDNTTTLIVQTMTGLTYSDITENTEVTITGTPTPKGLDLHRSVVDRAG